MNRVRLVVVDDHSLFRAGLISLLNEMDEFQVVGEAGDGAAALQVVRKTQPDVVLLDVNMPVMDGIETLAALRKSETCRVLMLTISAQENDLFGAISAGADGYLLKSSAPDELRRAILLVSQGLSVLSPQVTRQVMRAAGSVQPPAGDQPLTDRELEVLRCLSQGNTTAEIAAGLYISENTVKTHVRHILEKLNAANRLEAVSKAVQFGLLP